MTSERVAVIGAGIVGLAHAWREAASGARVTLFERSPRAEGASVRNFGMVWPIGQPADRLDDALRSRALWDEFRSATGVWGGPYGSLHVATREDEARVLEEFADGASGAGYRVELLSGAETAARCPATASRNPIAGLYSDTELGVDPREAVAAAPGWLAERYGVELCFGTTVVEADGGALTTSDGGHHSFDRVTIASGADFQTLFPDVFADHAVGRCKLQMMRTTRQPSGWRLGPMVASGLTLRHYPTFAGCPGHSELRQRIATETPELDRYGIHVMAAQNGRGEVVLGDSHEYGEEITPFDNDEITRLMIRELQKIVDFPDWTLAARWHGIYAIQSPPSLQFVHQPSDAVTIVIATGGCGMTMSFGLADKMVKARQRGENGAKLVEVGSGEAE
ncbi:MAG: TIGR03364 family FAD-dependent oxidoreductase [Lacipirellulaceae bacterium]